jgi:3-oxoacyl-[acyl-carrier-protein] synthase-3
MIGIRTISSEIPTLRIENAPRARAAGIDENVLRDCIGIKRISRRAPRQETSDLCVAAALKLFEAEHVSPSEVDCAAVVTQNPDGYGIPHTASIVQVKLGLPESCASFDIGLGGSGYVYGLSIVKSFMESNGLRCGLLFTCDPYSRVIDEFDGCEALIFGDAASVTLLTDNPRWAIGRFDSGTSGSRGHSFDVRLRLGGRLHMDHGIISEVAVERGTSSLRKAIALNELTIDQIDRGMVHQGSREVVRRIGQGLGVPDKAGFYAEDYGDTVSSSIPIALAQNIAPTDRVVALCGYGTGLSWATTVLTRVL